MDAMETKVLEKLATVKLHLYKVWQEIGLDEKEKEDKIKVLTAVLVSQMKSFEEEEKIIRGNQIKVIDELALKLYHLTNNLKIPTIAEPDGNLTLRQLQKYLSAQLQIYQEEEDKRNSILKSLRQRESELCKNLKEEPFSLPPDIIPTYDTLDYLKKAINSLEKEYENRKKSYYSFKASISAYMEELAMKPSSSFERDILSDVEGLVTLSQKNLKKMKILSKDLQSKIQQQTEREEQLRNEIHLLWDRLSVSEEKKETFLLYLSGSTVENLVTLEAELKELQELKYQNLGCFINKIRRELEEWWENCYICEEEKENFVPYFSEEYTDDILEAHEKEVQRLKDIYSQNEKLFLQIDKWQKVWQTLTELDEKVNDPARLFKNRGCALLQEEKERKKVNNELPRIEHAIEQRISCWEKENMKPFLVCGQPFKNFIKFKWQTYNTKKIREKQLRQDARSKLLHQEALHGTSKTPPAKRNLRPDTMQVSKYMRNNESQRTPTASSTFGSSLSLYSSRFNQAKSPKNGTRITRARRAKKPDTQHQSTFNSSEMSYAKFTEGIQLLNEHERMHSSITSNNLLSKPSNIYLKAWTKSPLSSSKSAKSTPSIRPRHSPMFPSHRMNPSSSSSCPRRRSARLNPPMPGFRSSRPPFGQPKLTTPIRNKLNILM